MIRVNSCLWEIFPGVLLQNLCPIIFLQKTKLMTKFHKKCWLHRKNDPREQILIWYCILRVTYTNFSILSQLCSGVYGGASNESPHLLISKKSSPCRIKLRMSLKTIQLVCIALQMTSFCMIQVSTGSYFRIHCTLWSQKVLSLTYYTYQVGN